MPAGSRPISGAGSHLARVLLPSAIPSHWVLSMLE
jgi:hypothetical protein